MRVQLGRAGRAFHAAARNPDSRRSSRISPTRSPTTTTTWTTASAPASSRVEELAQIPLFARYHAEVRAPVPGTRRPAAGLRDPAAHDQSAGDRSDRHLRGALARRGRRRRPPRCRSLLGAADRLQRGDAGAQPSLKSFLREHVYKHYKVRRMTSKARRVMTRAVRGVPGRPGLMPEEHAANAARLGAAHGAGRPCTCGGRLHRRHDGPLRDPRAPAAVRSERKNLKRRLRGTRRI